LDLLGRILEYILKNQLNRKVWLRLRECVTAKGAANVALVSQGSIT